MHRKTWSYGNRCFSPTSSRSTDCNATLLNLMTKNPVPCGTDGLKGNVNDTAHGLIVRVHIVEEMEENLFGVHEWLCLHLFKFLVFNAHLSSIKIGFTPILSNCFANFYSGCSYL